jgi:hypothetical protein
MQRIDSLPSLHYTTLHATNLKKETTDIYYMLLSKIFCKNETSKMFIWAGLIAFLDLHYRLVDYQIKLCVMISFDQN